MFFLRCFREDKPRPLHNAARIINGQLTLEPLTMRPLKPKGLSRIMASRL